MKNVFKNVKNKVVRQKFRSVVRTQDTSVGKRYSNRKQVCITVNFLLDLMFVSLDLLIKFNLSLAFLSWHQDNISKTKAV